MFYVKLQHITILICGSWSVEYGELYHVCIYSQIKISAATVNGYRTKPRREGFSVIRVNHPTNFRTPINYQTKTKNKIVTAKYLINKKLSNQALKLRKLSLVGFGLMLTSLTLPWSTSQLDLKRQQQLCIQLTWATRLQMSGEKNSLQSLIVFSRQLHFSMVEVSKPGLQDQLHGELHLQTD